MSERLYFEYGGGLGDVWYDYLHDGTADYFHALTHDCNVDIRIITRCANPGVADLFLHNPYISAHIEEPWEPASPATVDYFRNPIDGYGPGRLHNRAGLRKIAPEIYLTPDEAVTLTALFNDGPVIVAQPFAGLSNRDAFNDTTLRAFINHIAEARPDARVVVVGATTGTRGEPRPEVVGFTHPNMLNLIDCYGIRFGYHLTARAHAYVGAFSNLIRAAWDHRRASVVVVDAFTYGNELPRDDERYTYGWKYPETLLLTPDDIADVDTQAIANHVLAHLPEAK